MKQITVILTVASFLLLTVGVNTIAQNTIPEVTFNSTQIIKTIPDNMVGINGWGALIGVYGNNPTYIQNLKKINPKTIRFHDNIVQDATENWRAFGNKWTKGWAKWKVQEFATMIRSWRAQGINPEITFTINGFPDWIRQEPFLYNGKTSPIKLLHVTEWNRYGDYLAELVRLLNVEQKLGIKNFEITNELDSIYSVKLQDAGFPRKMNELAKIVNIASNKMKAIDPSIRTGGPSLTRPDRLDGVAEFIREYRNIGGKNLDFFSYHTYVSGGLSDTDDFIFERISGNIRFFNRNIRALLDSNGFTATQLHLNEFNIAWNYNPVDTRMHNNKGAIFDALAYIEAHKENLQNIASWADMDSVFGKMDNQFKLRPASGVINLFSTKVKGQLISTTSNVPKLTTMGYRNGNLNGLILVNSSSSPKTISIKGFNSTTNITRIDTLNTNPNLFNQTIVSSNLNSMTIEPMSIMLLEK